MSEVPDPARPRRLDSLTGLRWWAAFVVFGHHMANLAPIPAQPVLALGHLGVTFFFVLSGFVLTWSWSPRTATSTFLWRRFARIYPAHLVALLAALPVFYAVVPDPEDWWVKPFSAVLLLSVVLLQGWSRDPAVLFSGNPAAWTLSCEAFFYAMHPVLQRTLHRVGRRGALAGAAAVLVLAFGYRAAAVATPDAWWSGGMPWPVVRLTEFALGMCLAWAVRKGWRPSAPPWLGYLAVAALATWAVAALARSRAGTVGPLSAWGLASLNELAVVACAALVVLVATRDLRGGRSLLRARPLVRLGELSYAFYLVHGTVVYLLRDSLGVFPAAWTNVFWYAVALVGSLALAAAVHLLVEKPAERVMRRWWDARRARVSALPGGPSEVPSTEVAPADPPGATRP
jgi:peptidoglycan/LPS O-acetylase OafA/YrhL